MSYAQSQQSRNDRNRQQTQVDPRAQRAARHARNERLYQARESDRELEASSLRDEVDSYNMFEDR